MPGGLGPPTAGAQVLTTELNSKSTENVDHPGEKRTLTLRTASYKEAAIPFAKRGPQHVGPSKQARSPGHVPLNVPLQAEQQQPRSQKTKLNFNLPTGLSC